MTNLPSLYINMFSGFIFEVVTLRGFFRASPSHSLLLMDSLVLVHSMCTRVLVDKIERYNGINKPQVKECTRKKQHV